MGLITLALLLLGAGAVLVFILHPFRAPQVEFQDEAFKNALCTALGKDSLYQKDLDAITDLIIIGDEAALVNSGEEVQITDTGCILGGQEMTGTGGIRSLRDLGSLPNLQSLVVVNQQISEFPELDSAALTEVCVAHNCLSDLQPLMSLTNLKVLDASYNLLVDMSGFSCGSALESLYLSGNAISNLDFFVGSSNSTLKNLRLDSNVLVDIMPLSYLIGLETLDLSNNEIANAQYLNSSFGMVSLNISGNRIDCIDNISVMDELRELDASNNQIRSLYNVYEGIEKINLSNNAFEGAFEADYFPDAVEMSLGFNRIDSLIGMSACTKLQKLSIAYTGIADLSMLAFDNALTYLDISGDSIGSVEALVPWCTSLTALNVSDADFSGAEALGGLAQLEKIYAMWVPDIDNLRSLLPAVEVIG